MALFYKLCRCFSYGFNVCMWFRFNPSTFFAYKTPIFRAALRSKCIASAGHLSYFYAVICPAPLVIYAEYSKLYKCFCRCMMYWNRWALHLFEVLSMVYRCFFHDRRIFVWLWLLPSHYFYQFIFILPFVSFLHLKARLPLTSNSLDNEDHSSRVLLVSMMMCSFPILQFYSTNHWIDKHIYNCRNMLQTDKNNHLSNASILTEN